MTHILFVDDVIIYGRGDVEDWMEINRILKLFCCASGMQLNFGKSCFIFHKQVCAVEKAIKEIIPVKSSAIGDGLKYLGCLLKPNGYLTKDWIWLLIRLEKRIRN